jgi:[ribosomal protein S5]-alanine N-acetyltransferase
MTFILETSRLRLRQLTEADAPHFFALNAEPEAIRYTGDAPFVSEAAARQFLRSYDQYRRYGYGRWAVLLKSSGEWLGWCGLKYLPEEGETDIGFRFFKRCWGQGYATEAARACLQHGFGPLGLKAIVGRAMLANGASRKVLEKIGMKYEKSIIMDGQPGSYYVMREDSPGRVMLQLNAARAWDWEKLPAAAGQSFLLRRLHLEDAPSLARHANDPDIAFRLRGGFPHPYAEEDARKFIAFAQSSRSETVFAIELGGQAAGCISLMFREGLNSPSAEVGYWLGREYWGRGISSAALQIIVRHGFQDLGLLRIFAGVYANNPASRRVLEKNGFELEGIARQAIVRNGEILAAWMMGRLRDDCL